MSSTDTAHQAARVEVPGLGIEFTDNANIGKDPDGLLYYDAATDMSGDAKAKVLKVTFIAEDPFATVDAAGLNRSVRDGYWTPLNIGTANAAIYKRTSEQKMTPTADSISKKATMNYSGHFDVAFEGTAKTLGVAPANTVIISDVA
ncbi:hypothetical protein V8E53_012813 [Lactarius tabidus]